jgi:hypothetical protein
MRCLQPAHGPSACRLPVLHLGGASRCHRVHVGVASIGLITACVHLQKLNSATIAAVVEAIAAEQATVPTFSSPARDTPPFVAKVVQQHLSSAAQHLLQVYVQRHAVPLTTLVSDAMAEASFVGMAVEDVGPARPFCSALIELLSQVVAEGAVLLPGGESLPPSLVRNATRFPLSRAVD